MSWHRVGVLSSLDDKSIDTKLCKCDRDNLWDNPPCVSLHIYLCPVLLCPQVPEGDGGHAGHGGEHLGASEGQPANLLLLQPQREAARHCAPLSAVRQHRRLPLPWDTFVTKVSQGCMHVQMHMCVRRVLVCDFVYGGQNGKLWIWSLWR